MMTMTMTTPASQSSGSRGAQRRTVVMMTRALRTWQDGRPSHVTGLWLRRPGLLDLQTFSEDKCWLGRPSPLRAPPAPHNRVHEAGGCFVWCRPWVPDKVFRKHEILSVQLLVGFRPERPWPWPWPWKETLSLGTWGCRVPSASAHTTTGVWLTCVRGTPTTGPRVVSPCYTRHVPRTTVPPRPLLPARTVTFSLRTMTFYLSSTGRVSALPRPPWQTAAPMWQPPVLCRVPRKRASAPPRSPRTRLLLPDFWLNLPGPQPGTHQMLPALLREWWGQETYAPPQASSPRKGPPPVMSGLIPFLGLGSAWQEGLV